MTVLKISPAVEYKSEKGTEIPMINSNGEESTHVFIHALVTLQNWFDNMIDPELFEKISLVICDPPFGLKLGDWDNKGWKEMEYYYAIRGIMSKATDVNFNFFLNYNN